MEVSDVDVPEPVEGQVLVRTSFSGISGGTEALAYRGEIDPSTPLDETLGALGGTFAYPFAYGYSCVGVVERSLDRDVGEGSVVFAFHPHQEAVVVDATDVVPVDGVGARVATLFPLVETAWQVARDAAAAIGDVAVVQGLGAVGLLTALLLARGGADVVAGEPLAWRRDVGASLGVDAVAPDALAEEVRRRTHERGACVVIEVSGSPDALESSLGLLAHEGTVLVASWYGSKPVSLPLGAAFHRRRLTITSTQVSTLPARMSATWDRARRREAVRRLLPELPLDAVATHEFAFDRAAEAFDAVDRPEEGLVHAALRYG